MEPVLMGAQWIVLTSLYASLLRPRKVMSDPHWITYAAAGVVLEGIAVVVMVLYGTLSLWYELRVTGPYVCVLLLVDYFFGYLFPPSEPATEEDDKEETRPS